MKKVTKNRKRIGKNSFNPQNLIILCILICTCTLVFWDCTQIYMYNKKSTFGNDQEPQITDSSQEPASKTSSFQFVGVGDNLIHGAIYMFPTYVNNDYSGIYSTTNAYTQNADLAYINLETVVMGENPSEYSHYPVFNGPIEILSALNSAGFDWVSAASNHSMDNGAELLVQEKVYVEQTYPNMTITGANTSQEDQNTPTVIDVNGIKVGLTTFTYGTNGIPVPEEYSWAINVYQQEDGTVDYEMMKAQLDQLKAVSDVQIVSMHWGIEYATTPSQEQIDIASFLNQQGVEVIIGTHPHVIQPVEWIITPEQQTLVYYSLGNFLSAQDQNDRMVGGMADFVLNYNFDTKETTFSDVKFIPTITWYPVGYTQFQTYTINEWNDDLAATHNVSAGLGEDLSKQWVNDYVASIVHPVENVEIVTG